MTTSSSPVRGRALLMSTAAASFVLSAALVAGPASAAGTCTTSGTTTTCSGDFPTGLSFTPTTDLTVVTDSTVTSEGAVTVTGSGAANVAAQNAGSIVENASSTSGGIDVVSTTGNATIGNTGTVTTTSNSSPGLFAGAGGAGSATIVSTGPVSTSGAYSDGVDAIASGSGAANVTVGNVSATGLDSFGVFAQSVGGGPVAVTVSQNATVSGNGVGVAMASVPGSTITLANYGAIDGGKITTTSGATYAGYAVKTYGAAAVINNMSTGTLTGPISLGGAGNTVNNAGTWNVSGNSTFGTAASTNTLNNTGTIAVVDAPGATPGTGVATFTNLSALNNGGGGVIDLTKGDSLNTGTAVFNGATDNNSTLRINANSPSGILAVPSTGTGTTRVVLADVPGTHPAMNLKGQTVVTGLAAGAGPSEGSFNMGAPGINDQNAGFVDYRLVFNAATATDPSSYSLFGLPGQPVFEALNMSYAVQDFWRHSASAVTQRQMSIRDSMVGDHPSRPEGWEFWAVPFGGEDYFKRSQTFSFGGFTFPSIGNHNDTVGLQVGADMLANWMGGHGYWGFTGGVEQQTTHFQFDDSNNLYSVGGNIGMYGAVDWGGFYVNVLGKIDFDNMNTNFFTAGFSPTNTFKAYGARAEAGYRWPWQGFYVEPSVRVNSIWSDSIDLFPAGASLRTFNDDPVVDGEAGGRVGTSFNFGRFLPNAVNPFPGQFNIYFGAWWASQWNGQNRLAFTTFGGVNGPTTIGLEQRGTGSFIHSEYGLETADWYGGLKLFLKGTNDFNGDSVGGWSALAGVRWSF